MYRIVCKSEEEAQRVAAGVYYGIKTVREQVAEVFPKRAWEVQEPRLLVEQDTNGDWLVEIDDNSPDEPTELTIEEAIDQMDEEQED